MAYVTADDCLRRLTEAELIRLFADKATPTSPEPAEVDTDIFDPIAAAVAQEIDGYLRRRYAVPLSPVPAMVTKKAVSMVIYEGHLRRKSVPQWLKDEHDAVITWLKDCARGLVDLGVEPPPSENLTRGIDGFSEGRVFTGENMAGM